MSDGWVSVERALTSYVQCHPSKDWETMYVLVRFALAAAAAGAAARDCHWFANILAMAIGVDILVFNTVVVFVTGGLIDPFRSMVLTMVGYVSLALVFAPGWIAFQFDRGAGAPRAWDQLVSGVYQSVRTMTTAGPEGVVSTGEKLFASFETLVGVYFLSIILAGYVSWLGGKS
jgi:hypothetical protein